MNITNEDNLAPDWELKQHFHRFCLKWLVVDEMPITATSEDLEKRLREAWRGPEVEFPSMMAIVVELMEEKRKSIQ